ncbi:hypothetical protein [Corynebacterium liangguodongii]|uniref:Uncharacterized protein n=1 Tax=Corynebacterium liangguodongii TaxID=2079535 RepID=A0A2S0WG83_9CORY|nr:hypothetical protein [Corynebacterium liangguodongii]AWB84770.1 hypothetical protein C3E79_10040 [Corynebacterium liangguodongii]PWB99128.1 hypothetical protein DF219_07655 [Corynebacterium liangguodongii]
MSQITSAVHGEVKAQPFWLRYKASIIIVGSGLVSIIAQLAASPDLAGTQAATVLTIVATAAGFLINRFTRDGITPSMAPRLEAQITLGGTSAPTEHTPQHSTGGPAYTLGSSTPAGE